MNSESASEYSFNASAYNVEVKQEPSVHEYDNVSMVSNEMSISTVADTHEPCNQFNANGIFDTNLRYAFESNLIFNEKPESKKEEKPVVHRNTGKISVENYRRRKLLSRNLWQNGYSSQQREQEEDEQQQIVTLQIEPAILLATSTESEINRIVPSPNQSSDEIFISDDENEQNFGNVQQIFAAPRLVIAATVDNNRVYCTVCRQFYASRRTFKSHEKSKKHLGNLGMQQ